MNIMLIMFMIPIIILGTAVFSINKSIIIENPVQIEDETTISSDMAIDTFNAQFTAYEGMDMSSATVRALFSIVEANNMTNTDHVIEIDDSAGSISTAGELTSSETYNVKLHYDDEGYIYKIQVTK